LKVTTTTWRSSPLLGIAFDVGSGLLSKSNSLQWR
jgi:hypothetical protein